MRNNSISDDSILEAIEDQHIARAVKKRSENCTSVVAYLPLKLKAMKVLTWILMQYNNTVEPVYMLHSGHLVTHFLGTGRNMVRIS